MPDIILNIATILIFLLTLLLLIDVLYYLFYTKIPFVPSKTIYLKKFLEANKPPKKAIFYDLGSGDGKVLFTAEKFGLSCIGYEIAPFPYLLSQIKKFFLRSKSKIYMKNFLKTDWSNADYIYCYLFPDITNRAYAKAEMECKPGTYFICNTFKLKLKQPLEVYRDKKQKAKLFIYKI